MQPEIPPLDTYYDKCEFLAAEEATIVQLILYLSSVNGSSCHVYMYNVTVTLECVRFARCCSVDNVSIRSVLFVTY
jgi:hypothetical protein